MVVSSTVKDLVAGSGLTFADRGHVRLKGVPGEWHLYAVDPALGDYRDGRGGSAGTIPFGLYCLPGPGRHTFAHGCRSLITLALCDYQHCSRPARFGTGLVTSRRFASTVHSRRRSARGTFRRGGRPVVASEGPRRTHHDVRRRR